MFDSLLCLLTFYCLLLFRDNFFCFVKTFGYILLCFPGPSKTVRGSNFYDSESLLLCFTLCAFVTKRGSNFYFWTGNVFPNQSSDFCPRMAKVGVC
jgi:hypothetical protein